MLHLATCRAPRTTREFELCWGLPQHTERLALAISFPYYNSNDIRPIEPTLDALRIESHSRQTGSSWDDCS